MISHFFFLFLGLCQAVILPSKNLQTFVSGFNVPHDLKKVKLVDKNWIDMEKVYTIVNPEDGPLVHKETNQIFHVFSNYIGVKAEPCEWVAQRWSEHKQTNIYNGNFDYERKAARASDTLARKLIKNGEQCHMLNFPDYENTYEVYGRKSKYFGITYNTRKKLWLAYRRSKNRNMMVYAGHYKDDETAARASDTLARKLMTNGEEGHNLNFLDDGTARTSYFGITYKGAPARWQVQRYSEHENKMIYSGCYECEELAAHASDILARELMANGERGHRLNFPDVWGDDDTDLMNTVHPEETPGNKRKRPEGLEF